MTETDAADRASIQSDQALPAAPRWTRWEAALLVLLLCLAALLRLWRLESNPPGLTHDEAGHAHDTAAILDGARPLYETVGYGREPLYDYVAAATLALTGRPTLALRLVSACAGLGTLALAYGWARRAFGIPVALLATSMQAASFWSLSTSRQALRSSLLPLLFALAVYAYWRLLMLRCVQPARRGIGWAALTAVAIGASLWTYLPARVLWALFPLFLIYLALWVRPRQRRNAPLRCPGLLRNLWVVTLITVAAGLVLAAPLFVYLNAHPELEQRLTMLDAPLQALRAGDLSVVRDRAIDYLAGLVVSGRGDGFLAYNIPGRPVMDWVTGLLAVAGFGICVLRWRRPAYAFLVLWFVVGSLPSLVTGAAASSTRSIAVLPALFTFPALAIWAGLRWATRRWGLWALYGGAAVLVGWGLANGTRVTYDYFGVWGRSPHVRAAYQHTLVQTARYLDAHAQGGTVVLSSVYPQAPHDPYVLAASMRADTPTRWCDARRALLLPDAAGVLLVAPASAPLDAALAALPGLRLLERVDQRADDLDPYFEVYAWDVRATRVALLETMDGGPRDLALPVDFGGQVSLLGYHLRSTRIAPGSDIELLTLWKVTDAPAAAPSELVLFAHALDADGRILGQEDRLDAPSWDWRTGDSIVQLHRITLASDAAPGAAVLQVGVYGRADLARLPVLVADQPVDDRAVLATLEVTAE